MSTLNVDKVDPSTGTTLELGTSGDTISIPSGVTIANSGTATGFGVSLANGVDNRVVTSSSATALNGEANLTYDGTSFVLASGRQLVGTSTAEAIAGTTCQLQVEGTTANTSSLSITRNADSASPPFVQLCKTRSATVNGDTIVADGDTCGRIVFAAADGVDRASEVAYIDAKIDGTPGADDTPGKLSFYTTADGAQSVTERLSITASGRGKSVFTGLAWAHFDGIGTPSIQASHNVSSVSDSETGQMRVNFTANIADANYAAVVNSWWGYAYSGGAMDIYVDGFKATTSNGSAYTDVNSTMISVFGNP